MPYLNRVELMGRLTADPEVVRTGGINAVCSFTIAVNYRGRDGREGRADFFDCEVWGGWAENLVKTAERGSWVFVEGRLRQDRWVDKVSGQKRSRLKVHARRVFHFVPQYADSREPKESAEVPF